MPSICRAGRATAERGGAGWPKILSRSIRSGRYAARLLGPRVPANLVHLSLVKDLVLVCFEVCEHLGVLCWRRKPHRSSHCVAPYVHVFSLESSRGHENAELLVPQDLRCSFLHLVCLGQHRRRESVVSCGGSHGGHQPRCIPVENGRVPDIAK